MAKPLLGKGIDKSVFEELHYAGDEHSVKPHTGAQKLSL